MPGEQRGHQRATRTTVRAPDDHHPTAGSLGQEQPAGHALLGHHVLGDVVGDDDRAYDVSTVCSSLVARSVTRIGCSTSQS